MASCVAVAPDNTLFLDTLSSPDSCAYLLITNADYQANLNINALFAQYLAFDPVLSGTLLGAFIVSFVAGHVLGKVLAGLRRV